MKQFVFSLLECIVQFYDWTDYHFARIVLWAYTLTLTLSSLNTLRFLNDLHMIDMGVLAVFASTGISLSILYIYLLTTKEVLSYRIWSILLGLFSLFWLISFIAMLVEFQLVNFLVFIIVFLLYIPSLYALEQLAKRDKQQTIVEYLQSVRWLGKEAFDKERAKLESNKAYKKLPKYYKRLNSLQFYLIRNFHVLYQ